MELDLTTELSRADLRQEEKGLAEFAFENIGKVKPTINVDFESTNEGYLTKELFRSRGFIQNEQWGEPKNIQAQIIKFDKTSVVCNCAIDLENNIFQTRVFPIILFQNIDKLEADFPVLIRLCEKPGSSRIDVIDGRNNLVDVSIFDRNSRWSKLKEGNFNTPVEPGTTL